MSCQPKGSMCMGCSNGSAACAGRDFGSMPVIQVYADGVMAEVQRPPGSSRAGEPEAQAEKWAELAQQTETAPSRVCIQCGAPEPAGMQEGEGLPCGH